MKSTICNFSHENCRKSKEQGTETCTCSCHSFSRTAKNPTTQKEGR